MKACCIQGHNSVPIPIKSIPILQVTQFHQTLSNLLAEELRMVMYFGCHWESKIRLFAILAEDLSSTLWITSCTCERTNDSFPSLSSQYPALQIFEREIYEQFGLVPEGHPWLKPVRFEENSGHHLKIEDYPFFQVRGEEVHEVGVGPVHAGIIEPGHFRFQCHGEEVFHLEIQLGYQHRGIEKLCLQRPLLNQAVLMESIAGDTSVGHVLAYAQAVESLCQVKSPQSADWTRLIALELERMAMHIADLGGIAGDVAFLPGTSVYGRLRTLVINTLMSLCGSRFGRGLIRPGGVLYPADLAFLKELEQMSDQLEHDLEEINRLLLDSTSVMSRLERTGILTSETAKQIGMVGFVARCSGISRDIRHDHPVGAYQQLPKKILFRHVNDVVARTQLRMNELEQSLALIRAAIAKLSLNGNPIHHPCHSEKMAPNTLITSLVEGWRGEIAHCLVIGSNQQLSHYKIKDPSFHNWFGLAHAVKNNGISDFPLCNKSFDLSYCGFDL